MSFRKIDIDDEVYAAIQRRAVAYVDKIPNDTLRRVFGLDHIGSSRMTTNGTTRSSNGTSGRARTKRPKASLIDLERAGIVSEGQTLHLVDHRGTRVAGGDARIARGGKLEFSGQLYSMSYLAAELLKQEGYRSDSARGPQHWATDEGVTIKALWEEYTNSR